MYSFTLESAPKTRSRGLVEAIAPSLFEVTIDIVRQVCSRSLQV